MDGVKSAKVDFDKKLAMVEYNEAKVTPLNLEETVGKVSDAYKVSAMKTVDKFFFYLFPRNGFHNAFYIFL